MNRHTRPMYSPEGMIRHLKEEGVEFRRMDEAEALEYLTSSTNFFKINTYKKNFVAREQEHSDFLQYDHLDFACLRELSDIDRAFRRVLSSMCLDVEHFVKVHLLRLAQDDPDEDGYHIVEAFRNSLNGGKHALDNEIERNVDNPYCAAIISKYDLEHLPLWAFVEVIPFGRLLRLYQFYAEQRHLEREAKFGELLEFVRDVRNSVAHNNCMLCDLTVKFPADAFYTPIHPTLGSALRNIGIPADAVQNRLSNPRISQITALLYLYPRIVTDEDMRGETRQLLGHIVFRRMPLHRDYFSHNALLDSCYRLLTELMHAWYDLDAFAFTA